MIDMSVSVAAMTIQGQIATGNAQKISNGNLNYHKVLASNGDRIVINFESILTDYKYFLDKHITTMTFTDEQYLKYRFKPKSLSYDLYGSIEYAPLLLSINNVLSISEFDFKKVKIFDNDTKSFLNEVLNKEKSKIASNTAEVNSDLIST